MKTFFTSDLHFGHESVLVFDERPFKSVEEMNAELISRWNNKVGKGDIVYVLGDFIWKTATNEAVEIIKQLNGQIILIKGNHDRFLKNATAKKALAGVKDYDDICVVLEDGTTRRCVLSHYFIPFYSGHRRNAIHLHGHSHNTEEHYMELGIIQAINSHGYDIKAFNVGCMHWNYEPVTLDEILRWHKETAEQEKAAENAEEKTGEENE
ncbi:MAG: metallophosphoesterase [Ruminococcus sp.]